MYKANFFLGANSENGFVSYFDSLQERGTNLIVLKGGPGCGKSSLMKRVSAFLEKKKHEIDFFPCASDPDSLDGFIDKSIDFAMIDGTSPHVTDPIFPGASSHILNLGSFWDTHLLSDKKNEIKEISKNISLLHSGAGAYIKSAGALIRQNFSESTPYIKKDVLFVLSSKIGSLLPLGYGGFEEKRLLGAVSVGEIKSFKDTICAYADKIYAFEDKLKSAGNYFLKSIRSEALGRNVKIISCPSPINPDMLEHIIIPSERIAITSFPPDSFKDKNVKPIGNMYFDIPNISIMKTRLEYIDKLLFEGAKCVEEAKNIHDALEEIYVSSMDYSQVDGLYEKIVSRL